VPHPQSTLKGKSNPRHSNDVTSNMTHQTLDSCRITFAVVTCVQSAINVQLPNFREQNVKLDCACTHVLEITTTSYIYEL
jgi:hypothetical protein